MLPEKLSVFLQIERNRIVKELRAVEPLRRILERRVPDEVELRAVASVLHAVYNGFEAVLKKSVNNDGGQSTDKGRWHRVLLNQAITAGPDGTSILSQETALLLEGLLAFRHFYRNSYGNDLNWDLMKPLWDDLPDIVERFFRDVYLFYQTR